jgi:hypothetical protein
MKKLWTWIVALDRILRGETTRIVNLRDGAIDIPLGGLSLVLVLLGMAYGVCMGTYAVVNQSNYMQMVASMVKVPALFLLTLAVTLPSLYVFNALVGSRLTIPALLRLFVAALGVGMAVLASLGPIVAFFSVNTTTYSFIVLLNVLVFAVSGFLSLGFMLQTLHRISIAPYWTPTSEPRSADIPSEKPITEAEVSPLPSGSNAPEIEIVAPESSPSHVEGPLENVDGNVLGKHTKAVFRCWMIVFGLVGAQMGWVLRPFIGSPEDPFEAVWRAILSLFG